MGVMMTGKPFPAKLYWDAVNNWLGVGISPSVALDVAGAIASTTNITASNSVQAATYMRCPKIGPYVNDAAFSLMDYTFANYIIYATTDSARQVVFNGSSPNASAQVQIDSTVRGFLPPRMTTAQKNAIAAPAAGLTVYDSTLGKLCVYTGAAWETITSV
jgi:hypothetical protein